jgi:hypothetical protein
VLRKIGESGIGDAEGLLEQTGNGRGTGAIGLAVAVECALNHSATLPSREFRPLIAFSSGTVPVRTKKMRQIKTIEPRF